MYKPESGVDQAFSACWDHFELITTRLQVCDRVQVLIEVIVNKFEWNLRNEKEDRTEGRTPSQFAPMQV